MKRMILCLVLVALGDWLFYDQPIGWITWYNARNCQEVGGRGANIDLVYLRELGEEALPAADWLQDQLGDSATGKRAAALSRDLERILEKNLANWRGWSFLRYRLTKRAPHE